MFHLNKKDTEINYPVQLSSHQEIMAVNLGGPKVQLTLKVQEMNDPQKRQTQHGKKSFIAFNMVGEDDDLPVLVEAWEPHVSGIVKSMRTGTTFIVAFTPVPAPPALFAPALNWMIRLNTYARICDVAPPGQPIPNMLSYFAPPPPQPQQTLAPPVNDGLGQIGAFAGNGYGGYRAEGYGQGRQIGDAFFVPNAHVPPHIMLSMKEKYDRDQAAAHSRNSAVGTAAPGPSTFAPGPAAFAHGPSTFAPGPAFNNPATTPPENEDDEA